MPSHPYRAAEAHQLICGAALRTPLHGLSCPSAVEDVAVRRSEPNDREAGRSKRAAAARRWYEPLATEYWHPPTTRQQRARQRLLAVIVAFVLAAVLAHLAG